MEEFLTPEEYKEFTEHKVGTVINMDDQQFNLRLSIAKKMCKVFLDNDPTLNNDAKEMYENYPMWKFYCYKDMSFPQRVYGVEDAINKRLYVAKSFIALTHGSSVNCDEIISVDRWSEDQLRMIKLTQSPTIFLDPLGFLLPVRQFAT